MTNLTVEERLSELEKKVAQLLGEDAEDKKPVAWREQWFGAFRDNADFDSAMERGAEYRRSQPTAAEEYEAVAMSLLDTDHISLIARGGAEGRRILMRLSLLSPEEIAVSVISYEEQMRGWLAEIAATRPINRQELKYVELTRMLKYYCGTPLLPFDNAAISVFQDLWLQRLRVSTMDLKIAAVALANNAVLLTRNRSDFSKVPGLYIKDWSVEA